VIDRIIQIIQQAIRKSNVELRQMSGIVIGACGLVDPERGAFVSSSVMPDWYDVPLSRHVSAAVALPVAIENDANAAILGGWQAGVAEGAQNVVGMTLGTGIGGAAILNGRLFRGSSNQAGEFGHMSVDPDGAQCYCGNRGCLGLLASANGIVNRLHEQLQRGRSSVLPRQIDGTGDPLTAQMIFEAAMAGDELAHEIIVQTGKYIGIGVASLISCFNPEVVVLTGGMTRMGDTLLTMIRQEALHRTYPALGKAVRIELGILGEEVGVIGSAAVWWSGLAQLP